MLVVHRRQVTKVEGGAFGRPGNVRKRVDKHLSRTLGCLHCERFPHMHHVLCHEGKVLLVSERGSLEFFKFLRTQAGVYWRLREQMRVRCPLNGAEYGMAFQKNQSDDWRTRVAHRARTLIPVTRGTSAAPYSQTPAGQRLSRLNECFEERSITTDLFGARTAAATDAQLLKEPDTRVSTSPTVAVSDVARARASPKRENAHR